ncbi:MAG: hypothetical protein NVS9B4_12280 [Candidatus Acidiferrum sp.]
MAFEYFARQHVDFAIFEVGLGGRLDATNIVVPEICIITPVGFDHENFLGHSLPEIAREKAGILKPSVPVVLPPQHPEAREVILGRAQELGCPVIETNVFYRIEPFSSNAARITEIDSGWSMEVTVPLAGDFQLQNALNAIAAARLLAKRGFPMSIQAISQGIAGTVWPGRLEKLQSNPEVYLDGAHNPAAARELAKFLQKNFANRNIWLLYGALRDKAVDEVAGILFPLATHVLFTQPRTSRAISAAHLATLASHHAAHFTVVPEAEMALDHALAEAAPDDAIFITGSLYLVGQLRHYWNQRSKHPSQVATR